MASFVIENYCGRPPGQFGEFLGWAMCWEQRSSGRDRVRFTVTATKDGFAPIWLDVAIYLEDVGAIALRLMEATEADVRRVVAEVEELEASWRLPARPRGR